MVRQLSAVAAALVSLAACAKHSQSPLVSSSTQYRLCEQDTHCPGATYCSAGVCDFDCRADSDCGAGRSCDARGRCVVSTSAPPPPPKFAGKLAASATELALTAEKNQGTFTLQNSGQEAIDRFHLLSDDPAISATPAGGAIPPGGSITVTVTVDRRFAGRTAALHVLSTGGKADLAIDWGSSLAGRLEGDVTVSLPFQLGAAPIALEIGGPAASMTGAVDGAASLLWPTHAAVTASDDGTSFTAAFTIVAPPGDPANPLLDVPLRRSVQLTGTHTGPATVSGLYSETIDYGVLGLAPFETTGTFELRNVGPATGVEPASQPAFAQQNAPPPPSPCACPPGAAGCPSDAQGQADWFFAQGFGFEQLTDACNAQDTCMLADGATAACTVAADVQCALGGFAGLGSSYGQIGLIDVWRAQATYAMLQGKSQISNVLQPFGTAPGGTTLGQEVGELQAAVAALEAGLHGGGTGLLTAPSLPRAAALPALFAGVSQRDAAAAQPPLTDVDRFAGLVSSTLYGGAELVDRLHRGEDAQTTDGGSPPAAETEGTAQGLAVGALLDLAALGAVLPTGSGVDPIPGLTQSFELVAQSFDQAVKGLNAAGYPSDYVPFLYSASNPAATDVFMQIYDYLGGSVAPFATITDIKGDEAAFTSSAQSCADQALNLKTYAAGAGSAAAAAVTKLCGAGPLDGAPPVDCGTNPAGQIAQDAEAAQAAQAALGEAKSRQSAALQKIELLQQQLQAETGDYADEILAAERQGSLAVTQAQAAAAAADAGVAQAIEIAIYDRAKENENVANQVAGCVNSLWSSMSSGISILLGVPSGGGSGLPGAGCLPLANHLICGVAGDQQAVDAAAVQTAQAQQQAAADQVQTVAAAAQIEVTLLFGQEQIQDNAMQTQIVDATNDEQAASYEILRQTQLFDAAKGKVQGDLAQLAQVMQAWKTNQQLAQQSPVADPTFRLYQDGNGLKLSFDMRLARKWCFLAAKAFEYTVNASSTYPAQCFEAQGSADLSSALSAMYGDYGQDLIQYPAADSRSDVLSLARDVFRITGSTADPVTGQTLSAAQQFQALLALPTNRDANGNVELKFSTSIDPGNGLFSAQLANDVIHDLKMNLVSTELAGRTAYVTLIHSGTGRLRRQDGSLTQYDLEPRTSLVPAAINTDITQAQGVPASTDLFGRPVDDPSWTLIIDQSDDPRNAQIDVSQLSDLEILLDHQGVAIQQSP